jgi:F-type H+-transporting ATPase subunit epsilon
MTDKIAFDLVSPERLLLSEEAEMVTVPGTEGYMGVMAGHMPLVSSLKPGTIDVKGGNAGDARYFVFGGFVEVNPAKITVLADEALALAEFNGSAIDQRIANAEEDILHAKTESARAKAVDTANALRLLRAAL